MIMRKLITCFLAIFVMLIFFQHHPVAASLSPHMQKIALFQFKQSLAITTHSDCIIPSHPKTMNWSMSIDHCAWEGVSCENKTGDVIGVDLSCSQLEGAILPNSTLFQLSHLHFLNLSSNDFSHSDQFPQEFGFFAKGLTHLNLSRTLFSGRVPSGISHLYKLVSLDLSYNNRPELEDEVFKSLLQNLTQLRVLNLQRVNISSVLPGNLSTSLRVLNLGDTGLHGVVPSGISHLYKLVSLDLSYNYAAKLEDEVFKSLLQNLTQLRVLNLQWVNISSVLPGNLSTSLRVLNLEDTGLQGVVPQEVFHLPNLQVLDLSSDLSSYFYSEYRNNLTATLPAVKWGSSATLRHLYLSHINIVGGLPDSIGFLRSLGSLALYYCNLSGPIPRSIGDLSQLTFLDLSNCHLSGSIPRSIGHLSQLTYLKLSYTNLSGPIPRSIGHLSQLTYLYLSHCHLSGPIPRSIGHLSQLTYLDLSHCHLSGPIPRSIGHLSQLTYLELAYNNLNGPISTSLANLTDLIFLSLYSNNFTGPLPSFDAQFHSFGKLVQLYLSNNGFTGSLPPWLFHHPSLKVLSLDSNGFTGQLHEFDSSKSQLQLFSCRNNQLNGPIPQSFSQLVNLTLLDFSSNNFSGILDLEMFYGLEHLDRLDLSDNSLSVTSSSMATLPPKLSNLRLSSCNMKEFPHFSRDADLSLDWVDLSNNKIEGEIPHWIGSMGGGSFSYLNLSHNRLTGGLEQLPWNNIRYLDLHSNKLNGSLPTLICNSSNLDILNLSNNSLSGVLPPICPTNRTRLSVLDLRMNKIQGNIPATLSNFRRLETINLNGNKLEGRIPSSFAEFASLQVLDLGSNQINDTFPQSLEALQNLQVLVLKSNKFHGPINQSSKIEHPFPSLRIIDLSCNEFSGPLPAIYFKNFKAMMNADVNKIERSYMNHSYYYSDSMALVIKGVEIEFVKILTVFTTIDVSRNHFEGEIAEYIGNLVSLRYLNLSHNCLKGHIPSMIGKLSMLESLDISSNQLEGEIPQQLTSLYSLALLNLSCNQLSGHIPQGSQFYTFENDSYVGNSGLCGYPLSKDCKQDTVMQEGGEDEDDDYFFSGFTWEAVVIGYGCGVVPAFIIGNLMLRAGKPKWFAGIIARELGLKIRRMEIKWR